MPESDDPTAIRSIAVTAEDVVTALEHNLRSGGDAVLRVTPPFSGRMRARLHLEGAAEYDEEPAPVHVDPEALVADPPDYPEPAETEDELRADPSVEFSRERHRDRHRAAVEAWRDAVRDAIAESATLSTPAGEHSVRVRTLG